MSHGLTDDDVARLQEIVDERRSNRGGIGDVDSFSCSECGASYAVAADAGWCCRRD